MPRSVAPAKTRVLARPTAARKARREQGSGTGDLERRLAAALEQQAATSEILRVISASPTDAQPVLDAVAEHAARLCKAPYARVLLIEGDALRVRAHYSIDREAPIPGVAVPLKRTSISGRATLDRQTIHFADVLPLLDSEFPDARENAQLTGFRAGLAVPLVRQHDAYGAIFLWRREPGLFAPDEVALAQTFASQVAIAIDNVRLFRETKEALEQQVATSEILRVISQSPTDVQPVFETIVRNARALCNAAFSGVYLVNGETFSLVATDGLTEEERAAFCSGYPRRIGTDTVSGRAALEGRVVETPDLLSDPRYASAPGSRIGARTVLGVPMLRGGVAIGSIGVWHSQVKPFSESQVALLQTFADQAVIAIENVRLFSELDARNHELSDALERQTATSEVLKVISRSAFDLQPVLDAVIASAARLCGAEHGHVYRFDGELLRLAAGHSARPEMLDYLRDHPVPLGPGSISGIAGQERRAIHWHDVLTQSGYQRSEVQKLAGYRTLLAVPMLKGDTLLGVVVLWKMRVDPFSDKQIELVTTFADQAVIAIENVRLFTELEARNRDVTAALEQQTATSEILRVISTSPTDAQPVFETIAKSAARLCEAEFCQVYQFDGALLHFTAHHGLSPEGVQAAHDAYPMAPGRGSAAARSILNGAIEMIPDVELDPDYTHRSFAKIMTFRSIVAVPMLRNGRAIGSIAVARMQAGYFPERQMELLRTFADQAVIAIENVRLFAELQTRTTELTQSVGELKALGEVGQAVSSTLDLKTVLSTIVTRATQLSRMDGGAIYEYDEHGEQFYLHTADKLPEELVEALRTGPIRKGEGALGQLAVTLEPVQITHIAEDPNYQSRVREILIRSGYQSLLAVPLLREGRLFGGLVVNCRSAGEFAREVIDLLKTFAAQSALAIQNARLFREIESKSRELETASRHKSEFLANMSHELRTPLNAIIGFSEVLQERMFGEVNDKQAEYLADILESGRHLLSLINDILDLSKIEAGRMELDLSDFQLPGAIDNTLTLVRERAHRRGITLVRTIDERAGSVHADERKVKQVLLNLLSNALKFTPEGGRIEVRASIVANAAEVSVTDNGVGIAPKDQATVFEEFRQVGASSKKVEGTGLGLAISRKFIELHGGRIWVTSEPGVGSTFAFTLPLSFAGR